MGNAHASGRNLLQRNANSLGLSKAELDERCKPSGLYPSCQWEDRAVRRLIGDGKLAARLKGHEERLNIADHECPICFLQYSQINVTKCCNAYICTECYLQVRPQKEKTSTCPFCNSNKLSVSVAVKMDDEAVQKREEDMQKVIEAQIRARAAKEPEVTEQAPDSPAGGSFGSSLERNERVALMRARTSSMASEGSLTEQPVAVEDIASLAMTPEERQALEAEMRAQHNHPLSMRLQQEEAERRLRNEQEYYRTQAARLQELRARREILRNSMADAAAGGPGRRRRAETGGDAAALDAAATGRSRSGRDWNRIVNAFESSGQGSVQSLDDLVVLEAAIMLSMEEEARRRDEAGAAGEGEGQGEEQETQNENFDAERHASQGFPLARARIGRQLSGHGGANRRQEDVSEQLQSLMRNINRRRGNRSAGTSQRGVRGIAPDHALDAVGMAMRGVSEEEQIAMAIAASLADQGSGATNDGETQEEETTTSGEGTPAVDEVADGAPDESPGSDTVREAEQSTTFTASTDSSSHGPPPSTSEADEPSRSALSLSSRTEEEEVDFAAVDEPAFRDDIVGDRVEETSVLCSADRAPSIEGGTEPSSSSSTPHEASRTPT